ncbi:hypothetical protein HMI55_004610 [Coelomomyces lativittatus]|nr:hypothetical protein HMI56_003410 [Coelomomyces lativittatus]KAJ1514503.1 hypothetical protein HMI55_004610 [Coelomomyces lativittatus]
MNPVFFLGLLLYIGYEQFCILILAQVHPSLGLSKETFLPPSKIAYYEDSIETWFQLFLHKPNLVMDWVPFLGWMLRRELFAVYKPSLSKEQHGHVDPLEGEEGLSPLDMIQALQRAVSMEPCVSGFMKKEWMTTLHSKRLSTRSMDLFVRGLVHGPPFLKPKIDVLKQFIWMGDQFDQLQSMLTTGKDKDKEEETKGKGPQILSAKDFPKFMVYRNQLQRFMMRSPKQNEIGLDMQSFLVKDEAAKVLEILDVVQEVMEVYVYEHEDQIRRKHSRFFQQAIEGKFQDHFQRYPEPCEFLLDDLMDATRHRRVLSLQDGCQLGWHRLQQLQSAFKHQYRDHGQVSKVMDYVRLKSKHVFLSSMVKNVIYFLNKYHQSDLRRERLSVVSQFPTWFIQLKKELKVKLKPYKKNH